MQNIMDPLAPPPPPPPFQQQPPPTTFNPPPPPPPTTFFPVQSPAYVINPTPNFAPPPPPTPAPALDPPPPAPPTATATAPSHPPYAQMITEAITALNERTGSSKSAIAKYIDRVYSNLPETHLALLSHHLKRLKESGQLFMIKNSYKLAGSAPQVQANGPKRRPGRPPKAKPAEFQPAEAHQPQQPPVNGTAGSGFVSVPESVFASLGLVDGPVAETKRRPGRPRKAKAEAGGVVGLQAPPNPIAVAVVKKRPGRPAKNPAAVANNAAPVSAVGRPYTGKPRGRPRKNALAAAASGSVGGAAAAPALVPAGYVADAATVMAPAPPTLAPAAPTLKRRGWPPTAAAGPKRPRKLSGKPLGRPKKIGAAPAQVSNLQQLMAYQELRSKLEFFQSRIKQTVGVLRPCLNAQSAGNAVAALQELEELTSIDVTAPLNLQNRQPPPPENQM